MAEDDPKDSDKLTVAEISALLDEYDPEDVRRALLAEIEAMGLTPAHFRRH